MTQARTKRWSKQIALPLKTWGGRRVGAGRKPKGDKAGASHPVRARVRKQPVHMTLRVRPGVPNLRVGRLFRTVRAALAGSKTAPGFSLAHFSVQSNYLHLLVEADSNAALARSMQGLLIRLAKRVNVLLGRRGHVFADRYHAHVLATPREVRHALVYVLHNARHHARPDSRATGDLDPCASWMHFDGWTEPLANPAPSAEWSPVAPPRTWLLRVGWRRLGLLRFDEVPRPA